MLAKNCNRCGTSLGPARIAPGENLVCEPCGEIILKQLSNSPDSSLVSGKRWSKSLHLKLADIEMKYQIAKGKSDVAEMHKLVDEKMELLGMFKPHE